MHVNHITFNVTLCVPIRHRMPPHIIIVVASWRVLTHMCVVSPMLFGPFKTRCKAKPKFVSCDDLCPWLLVAGPEHAPAALKKIKYIKIRKQISQYFISITNADFFINGLVQIHDTKEREKRNRNVTRRMVIRMIGDDDDDGWKAKKKNVDANHKIIFIFYFFAAAAALKLNLVQIHEWHGVARCGTAHTAF